MKTEKDQSILELLDQLKLQERGWCIRDYWEADLCAIGISSSQSSECLAYISTFAFKPGRYSCECEKSSGQSSLGYETVYEGHDLTLEELLVVLEQHLRSYW